MGLKNATSIDTSNFAKKVYLASLNSVISKLDIGKLETTAVDLRKPTDVVKNDVVSNIIYDKLVIKVKAI